MVKSTATTPRPIATVTTMVKAASGARLKRAQGVLDVADGVVDERGAALVAAFVGGQRRRAEARLRPLARRRRRQAFVDQLLRLALEVEGELVVQVLLDAVAA